MKKSNVNKKMLKYSIFGVISGIIIIILIILLIKVSGDKTNKQSKNSGKVDISKKEELLLDDICINEVATDYIEFYNKSNKKIDISGYTLSINGVDNSTFGDNVSIDKKGFFTIDLPEPIKNDGNDIINISDVDGKIIESFLIPYIEGDGAYGRITDGSDKISYMQKSKNAGNIENNINLTNKPVFSHPSGFYDDVFELEIYVPENCKVYYTLDGSEPTINDRIYDGAITIKDMSKEDNKYSTYASVTDYQYSAPRQKIDKCTVIRAISVNELGEKSDIVNASYFINIADKKTYNNMPVISIITEPLGLFDYYNGLYVKGKAFDDAIIRESSNKKMANYYQDRSVSAYIEYFEKEKSISYKDNITLKTHKNISVSSPHKGLEISGYSCLPNVMSGLNNFIKGDSWVLSNGDEDNSTLIRKIYNNELLKDTNIVNTENQLVALFLDGEYWGVYSIDEDFNSDFVARNYGVNVENVATVVNGTIKEGAINGDEFSKVYSYISNNDMTKETTYANASNMIDFESYIDCYIAQIFSGNFLYSTSNSSAWRTITTSDNQYEDGKWRWVYVPSASSTGAVAQSGYTLDTFLSNVVEQDTCFKSLICNEQFKQMFVEKFLEFSKKVYSLDNIDKVYNEVISKYKYSLGLHFSRFSGGDYNTFTQSVMSVKSFFENRKFYICNAMLEYFNIKDLYSVLQVEVKGDKNYSLNINGEKVVTDSKDIWTECMPIGSMVDISLEVSNNCEFDIWNLNRIQYEGNIDESNINIILSEERHKIEANVINNN